MRVDTGRARAGWHAAMSGLGGQFDFDSKVKEGESKVGEGRAKGKYIEKLSGMNKYVELVNAVDYIVFLEYGHSSAAPSGMVRISLRKMRNALPKELGREYKDDWKKAMRSTKFRGSKTADYGGLTSVVEDFREFGD